MILQNPSVLIVGLIAGACCILFGLYRLHGLRKKQGYGKVIEGRITMLTDRPRRQYVDIVPTVSYMVNGIEYENQAQGRTNCLSLNVGDYIDVRCDPASPTEIYLCDEPGVKLNAQVYLFIGALFIVLGFLKGFGVF